MQAPQLPAPGGLLVRTRCQQQLPAQVTVARPGCRDLAHLEQPRPHRCPAKRRCSGILPHPPCPLVWPVLLAGPQPSSLRLTSCMPALASCTPCRGAAQYTPCWGKYSSAPVELENVQDRPVWWRSCGRPLCARDLQDRSAPVLGTAGTWLPARPAGTAACAGCAASLHSHPWVPQLQTHACLAHCWLICCPRLAPACGCP